MGLDNNTDDFPINVSQQERPSSNSSQPSSVSSSSVPPKSIGKREGGNGVAIGSYATKIVNKKIAMTSSDHSTKDQKVLGSKKDQKISGSSSSIAKGRKLSGSETKSKNLCIEDSTNRITSLQSRKTNTDITRKIPRGAISSSISSQRKVSLNAKQSQISDVGDSADRLTRTTNIASKSINCSNVKTLKEREKQDPFTTRKSSTKLSVQNKETESQTKPKISYVKSSVKLTAVKSKTITNGPRSSNESLFTTNNRVLGNKTTVRDKGGLKQDVNNSTKNKSPLLGSRGSTTSKNFSKGSKEQITLSLATTVSSSIRNKTSSTSVLNKVVNNVMTSAKSSSQLIGKELSDEDQEINRRSVIEKSQSPVKDERRQGADSTKEREKRKEGERVEETTKVKRKVGEDWLRERGKRKEQREKAKESSKAEAQKLIEREKRDQKREHDRLKIEEREKRTKEDRKRQSPDKSKKRPSPDKDNNKRSSPEKDKKGSSSPDKDKKRTSNGDREINSEERERRKLLEYEKRRSEEREKRRSQERRKSADRERKSPEKRKKDSSRERRSHSREHERFSVSPEKKRLSVSSSASSESLLKMVQQNSSAGGMMRSAGGSTGAGGASGSQNDLTEAERAEIERRERIQRYKEERRKQIAARYGTPEWSSSEESGTGEETSYKSYRRRRKGREAPESSSTDQLSKSHENGNLESRTTRRGSSSEDVVMGTRSTRSSRYRHSARASSLLNNINNNFNNNNNSNNDINANIRESARDALLSVDGGVGEKGRGAASPELTPVKRPPDQVDIRSGVGVDSADSTTLSGSDGRSGRRRGGGEQRDKSNKRKSNLNRSTTTEEAVDPFPPPLAHLSDSNEDTPRRRRRRAPVSPVGGTISSVGSAEPLKTPEVVRHVVSRLTPPASPPTIPSSPPLRHHQSPQSVQPPHTFQPIQPAATQGTHSAPSTLDTRSRLTQSASKDSQRGGLERNNRLETEEALRKVPPKLAPLRKPEIPDVLRPKESTTLASPGVINTPPSSRPSSVVFEKPPLAPEGVRPATIRTSLRKPETGTCFLAARREKRDETKPDYLREIQKPKKGDRLSKSDMNLKIESSFTDKSSDSLATGSNIELCGASSTPSLPTSNTSPSFTEEVMHSRLEALTVKARDTLERVDRLHDDVPPPLPESSPPEDCADSVVNECERYLTINADRKETSPRMRHREITLAQMSSETLQTPSSMKGIVSDTGQKNGFGGSEGCGKESKWMAMEKEVKKEIKREANHVQWDKNTVASTEPSGPPIQFPLKDNSESPPQEIPNGFQHTEYRDNDVGSPDSSLVRSPDGKRGSRRCSLDGDASRTNSPDPQSILKRRSSREDLTSDRPTTPEPHSILKRKTSSRNSSVEIVEGDPKPILKKKSSSEELDHFEPRPILKKKSSTDDELDDRPRSILKSGRSREDLDNVESNLLLSPNPILKRSPRCDSEGDGELRPILKRRDTTDGVRLRLHVSDGEDVDGESPSIRLRSDSAPEAAIRMQGRSPPLASATPTHSILKKRGSHSPGRFDQMDSELGAILKMRRSGGSQEDKDKDKDDNTQNRPISPSLVALTRRESSIRSGERPLSVAERVAGMEASHQEQPSPVRQRSPTPTRSPGARPKVTIADSTATAASSSFERPLSLHDRDKESRRNSAFGLVADTSSSTFTQNGSSDASRAEEEVAVEAVNEAFLDRPVVEAFNSAMILSPPPSALLSDTPTPTTPPTTGSSSLNNASSEKVVTPDTPSSVSQKAAFFAQLEQNKLSDSTPDVQKRSPRFSNRRDRGTRHATQPVTEDEVSQAARYAETCEAASGTHDSDSPPRRNSLPRIANIQDTSSTSSEKKPDDVSCSGSVGARVALWTRKMEEVVPSPRPLDGASRFRRRSRSTRFKTQPVTMEEVADAHALNRKKLLNAPTETLDQQDLASGYQAAREAVMKTAAEVMQGLTPSATPRVRLGNRKSVQSESLDDDQSSDSIRGILKREGSVINHDGTRESPRSILKNSSSCDSRRASFSESEHTIRSILKPESPLPPPIGSPSHETKLLKGVLKKDSSLEDSKEIKSILKPESESLDLYHSSDSSSDDVTLTTPNGLQNPECDLAESVKDIDPIRHREEQPKLENHKVDQYKPENHRAELAEALRQVKPIKSKDDLAEALRQIEPIRVKERSREREDDSQFSTFTKECSSSSSVSSFTKVTSTVTTEPTMVSSSTTSSSNSESEVKNSVITNEAIVRRRNAHAKRYEDRRSMVELRSLEKANEAIEEAAKDAAALSSSLQQETSESSDCGEGFLRAGSFRRSGRKSPLDMDATQILRQSPLFRNRTSSASQEDENDNLRTPPVAAPRSTSPVSSINDRLAALQKSGEDGWKSKIKREGKDDSEVKLRPKVAGGNRERPVSLMERMSALETSSQQWRGRVVQSDASKFTVAHKIASQSASNVPSLLSGSIPQVTVTPDLGNTPSGSPLAERKKRSPSQKVFKSKTGGNLPLLLNKASTNSSRKDFKRSISTPNDSSKNEPVQEGPSVSVPQADDESFNAFFTRTSGEFTNDDTLILADDDLDHISVTASQLVVKRRSVRVNRRQGTSRNPLKALAAREDLKSEYTEVKMGVGERELRRMKVEELSKNSSMAAEALAGLASKENFSAVSLKKVENSTVVREMPPYTDLMLIQVKGRRHAQSKLVEPVASSVNQGDDFILITPSDVFHYKGEYANVIERAKAAEIALYIIQQKDMGITTARKVIELDENTFSERKEKFWSLLGGDRNSAAGPCGPADEDESVEFALVAANKIYEVTGESLVPLPDAWGQMPKYEILDSDKVLVLDFGSEIYVWAGKRGCGDERKVGLALARELWEEPYDYSDCDINPITPMIPVSKAKLTGTRPEWGLCAKITENVETILFKEKFIDWPDTAQQTRIMEVKKEIHRYVAPVSELKPCDERVMLEDMPQEPDLVLEMSHLGRGVEYYDEEERRLLTISTNDYKVWHVSEYGKVLMDADVSNHLYAGDTYVVRWYYLITASGRTLQGTPSKHNVTGRTRVAYFFWQGRGSSISDKGVSALMTVELDEERGPHIRVSMGMEPPAFLNLFNGGLVIHKDHEDTERNSCRLFIVRGEIENEGHIVEVDLDSSFLRSRGCLVLVNSKTGIIHLWHGAKALRHTRKVGNTAAQKLSKSSESSLKWKKGTTPKIKEQFEGAESREFWEDLGGLSAKKVKNRYFSMLEDDHSYDWTPRVWHLAATPDSFQATEIICSYRATTVPNPLPVLQLDLYSVAQPALFVIDGGHRVWVWQGWWPEESSEGEDFSATGSAVLRFNFARRAALETALNYCKLKAKTQSKALAAKSYKKTEVEVEVVEPHLVVAGMEPLEFTNLFPMWTRRQDVIAIQEKEGRWKHGEQHLVSDILFTLSRTQYTIEELMTKPLPDGVDPLHLEVYLNDNEFNQTLGMTRDEFYSLQPWKQTELKKKADLF